MTRRATFDREAVGSIRGLTSLTEPDEDEAVGAIVDLAVIGARGDGKTQFIVHAIRTLRAYAPVLAGAEHQYNLDVLQVVMNAREPRPEATAPGVIPHYVFRIRPRSLLAQVGPLVRWALYGRVAGLWRLVALALCNALAVMALFFWLGRAPGAVIAAGIGLFAAGALAAGAVARSRFVRRGDIELVFWDVAGEHVYSGSAADYYSFLNALVRRRRERSSAARAYAFAPVLICNPTALGTRAEGSSYARLRKLIPIFASLNEPLPRAMVAINRWTVVKEVCAPDTDRDELVAVVPHARATEDEGDDRAQELYEVAAQALPVVRREVLRKHCLDAEDGVDNEVHFTYLRYDAGMQCEFRERRFGDWDAVDPDVRARFRAPTSAAPAVFLDYEFEDGPGSFEGEVRQVFLGWAAELAFHGASYRKSRAKEPEHSEFAAFERPGRLAGKAEAGEGEGAGEAGEDRAAPLELTPVRAPRRTKTPIATPVVAAGQDAWRPRPLSASGLEAFAQGTIVPPDFLARRDAGAERIGDAVDAALTRDEAPGEAPGEASGEATEHAAGATLRQVVPAPRSERTRTNPGFGSLDETIQEPIEVLERKVRSAGASERPESAGASERPDDADASERPDDADASEQPDGADASGLDKNATLRMPGGFGSGGS